MSWNHINLANSNSLNTSKRIWSIESYVVFSISHSVSFAATIDVLSKTAVFIRQQSQRIEKINGVDAELWFRYPETQDFKPLLVTNTGTGYNKTQQKRLSRNS